MDWELDLGNKKASDLDREISKIPAGYYFASFVSDEDSNENGAKTLHFAISRGDFKGKRTNLVLSHPKFVQNEQKAKDAANRMTAIATRMGAIAPDATGRARTNFPACVGKEYLLKIVHREKDGQTYVNIDYLGVYPVDGHDDIPNAARTLLGLPLKAGSDKSKDKDKAGAGAGTGASAGTPATTAEAAAKLW